MLASWSAVLVSRFALGVTATAMPPVSVSAAPDLPCPTPAALQQALAEVRGADAPVGANAFALRLERSPAGLRADFADPVGAPVWSRELTTAPSECESAARAVALIVERHFRELAWAPEPTPLSPPAEPAAVASTTVTAVAAPPPPRRPPPRLTASLGPAYWTRANSFGVVLDARVRLPRAPLFVGLGVFVPPAGATLDLGSTGGKVEVTSWPVLGSVGIAHAPARNVALSAGAGLMLTVERGQTQSIAVPATAWRTVLAGGLEAGASLGLGENLLLTARLGGYRAALGRSYTVSGIDGNLLDPPRWQAILGLGLGWIIRP